MLLIFSIKHKKATGRRIYSLLANRLKVPERLSRVFTKILMVLLHPIQFLIRKYHAYFSLHRVPFEMRREKGYVFFSEREIPSAREALMACDKIIAEAMDFDSIKKSNNLAKGKPWRANILKTEHLVLYPEILKFATSPEIVSAASKYLGTVPVLGDIQLWWTIENDKEESSQLYHVDQEDFRQAKVFMHINNVTAESGPLSFVPANESKRIATKLKHSLLKYTDDDFFLHTSTETVVKSIGPRGTGVILDTSSCYHQGSRTKKGERLVLMFNFIPYNCIRESHKEVLIEHEGFINAQLNLQPISKLVL